MFLGTLLVTVIYVLCNVMYAGVLPMQEIATAPADRVASVAAGHFLGAIGAGIIAVMIMISTFGCNNGLVLSGARVYYTMAGDGLFFSSAGKLNEKGVPETALWMQGIWASLLCISGKYSDLLNYVIFVVLIFMCLPSWALSAFGKSGLINIVPIVCSGIPICRYCISSWPSASVFRYSGSDPIIPGLGSSLY